MHGQSQTTHPPSQSISDLLSTIMVLCRGRDENGEPCWAYLCIKPSMAKAFHDARKLASMDIGDYGTIIESGRGEHVPEDVQKRMAHDYGARHDYEQQLAHAVEQIKARINE
ncbi:MAG: hypothetical protein AB7L92_03825 [Alphaproteobacteria bacterium]